MTLERQRLDQDGFALLQGVVAPTWVQRLTARIPDWHALPSARRRHGATFAVSDLLRADSELGSLLEECGVTPRVAEVVGRPAFPIDALLFDKIPETNWRVPGHQDVIMPVAAAADEDGFSGWTTRHGVTHVQPPVAVLEELVAARLHLDDSSSDNGPLAVIPGSHRFGRLPDRRLAEFAANDYRSRSAMTGDLLLMRPLLVHRSARATRPLHRRVLHVVYAWRQPGTHVHCRE